MLWSKKGKAQKNIYRISELGLIYQVLKISLMQKSVEFNLAHYKIPQQVFSLVIFKNA